MAQCILPRVTGHPDESTSAARTSARIPARIAAGRRGEAWMTVIKPIAILASIWVPVSALGVDTLLEKLGRRLVACVGCPSFETQPRFEAALVEGPGASLVGERKPAGRPLLVGRTPAACDRKFLHYG